MSPKKQYIIGGSADMMHDTFWIFTDFFSYVKKKCIKTTLLSSKSASFSIEDCMNELHIWQVIVDI